jgi:hypothetical protein
MRTLSAGWLVAVVAVGLTAAEPGVGGTWTMTVDAGPHGKTTMRLELEQDGTKVTGTFSNSHTGDLPVEGEFVGSELHLATSVDNTEHEPITFTATLKKDGTLEGYLSSAMGDMTWTAERTVGKP